MRSENYSSCKINLLWYVKGNLGDCILACYSLLKIDLKKVDVTIYTNPINAKLIKDLNFPFNIIEVNNSIIGSLRTAKLFGILKYFFKNKKLFFKKFDVSIDPYRWRSGYIFEQFFSIRHKRVYNRYNSGKKIDFSISELEIHRQFLDLANIPYDINSKFKSIVERQAESILTNCYDILIHPFSSEKSRVLKYEFICEFIEFNDDKKILLIGSDSDDKVLISKILNRNYSNLNILIKNFNFLHLAAQILNCRIIYGSESFVANFSSLLDKETIGLYSGVADPLQWYLPGAKSQTIRINVPCSPCFNRLRCEYECLNFKVESKI